MMKVGRAKGAEGQGSSVERRDRVGPGKRTLIPTLPVPATSTRESNPPIPADRTPPAAARETHAPLDGAKARQFGDQLGADFSNVQIHSGDGVAEDHGAAAVAFGRDIHFADGMVGGGSDALLGHELVHTVQQGAVPTTDSAPLTAGTHAAAEAEADRLGPAAASGVTGRVTVGAPAGIQRKPRQAPAGAADNADNAPAHTAKNEALATTPIPQAATPPAPSHPGTGSGTPVHRPGAAPAKPTKVASLSTPSARVYVAVPVSVSRSAVFEGKHARREHTARGE